MQWLYSLHHLIWPCGNAWISVISPFCRQGNFSDALCDLPKIAQLVSAGGLRTRIPVLFLLNRTTSMPAASRIPAPNISTLSSFSLLYLEKIGWPNKGKVDRMMTFITMLYIIAKNEKTTWKSKNEKWISMVGSITAPQRCLIPGTCEYVTYPAKGDWGPRASRRECSPAHDWI